MQRFVFVSPAIPTAPILVSVHSSDTDDRLGAGCWATGAIRGTDATLLETKAVQSLCTHGSNVIPGRDIPNPLFVSSTSWTAFAHTSVKRSDIQKTPRSSSTYAATCAGPLRRGVECATHTRLKKVSAPCQHRLFPTAGAYECVLEAQKAQRKALDRRVERLFIGSIWPGG